MNNRNKPCSCNSGLKYKKCCGSEAAKSAQRREEMAKLREAWNARAEARRLEEEQFASRNPSAMMYRRESPVMALAIMAALAMGSESFGRMK